MQKPENKQSLREKIRSARFLKHAAFFGLGCLSWLGFSYLYVLSLKIPRGRSIYNFPWSDDAPLWTFFFCLLGAILNISAKNVFGLLSRKSRSLLRDFVILICLIPVNSLLLTTFSISVLNLSHSGKERPVEFDWVMGFLTEFFVQTFVSMTCIGYFYLTLVNQTKEKLRQAQQAKTVMELKTLRQNIEPHFLFNNLNVLSSLIESDPAKANDFLNRLAELYRYILQTQTLETVALKDELMFAENYMYLLQARFGDAYSFSRQINADNIDNQKIVPVALQTLIENAVKHNAGSRENPLPISVKLAGDFISVENERRAKSQTRSTSRTGLQNLQMRYAFLTDVPVVIEQTDEIFCVKIPLI